MCVLLFYFDISNFYILGAFPPTKGPFQFFRYWGPPPKIQISGIRFKLGIHGNDGLMHISVSNFLRNIQQTSCMCYGLPRALSYAKWEVFFFFFHFFAGIFLVVSLQIKYETFCENFTQKKKNISGFLEKKYANSKKELVESEFE